MVYGLSDDDDDDDESTQIPYKTPKSNPNNTLE